MRLRSHFPVTASSRDLNQLPSREAESVRTGCKRHQLLDRQYVFTVVSDPLSVIYILISCSVRLKNDFLTSKTDNWSVFRK